MTRLLQWFSSGAAIKGGVALLVLAVAASALIATQLVSSALPRKPSAETAVGLVRPGEVSSITAPAALTIAALAVRVGDEVTAGQPLARLDLTELQNELAVLAVDVERARQQERQWWRTVGRTRDAVSRFDVSADASEAVTMAERDAQQVPARQVKDSTERAAAALSQAAANLQRLEQMAGAGLVAQREVEDARIAHRIAQDDFGIATAAAEASARLRAAQDADLRLRRNLSRSSAEDQLASQQSLASQAGLALKQMQLRYDQALARVNDPFVRATRAGVVVELLAHAGDRLQGGAPIAKLASIDPLEIDVDVTPLVANALRVGDAAHVEIPAVAASRLAGRVRAIAPVPADNGKYVVQVEVANPRRARLAGLAADVTLTPGVAAAER